MKKLFVIATLIAFCSAGVATAQSADKVSQQAPAKTTQKDEKKDGKSCCKKGGDAKACSSKDEKAGAAKSCCKGGSHDHAKSEEKK